MPLEFTEREIAPDITVVELIGTKANASKLWWTTLPRGVPRE
jgi:hypothetical protein